ncbi:hypothetical protein [Citrobacter phage Tr1]|nr:hypothetical protein [Citrobacter phage Tr1]
MQTSLDGLKSHTILQLIMKGICLSLKPSAHTGV